MHTLTLCRKSSAVLASLLIGLTASSVLADPCGMVPPVYVGNDVPIARVGEQKTYVFFKDGVETVVIRPGFEGKVEEFGMLIPFPAIPDLRKVSDNIFPHIAAAIDPPEIVIDMRIQLFSFRSRRLPANASRPISRFGGLALAKDQVRVVKEEAVGMYEVAVLEAGSAAALKKWVDEHGFQYPKGMDDACNDYVKQGWCFVAVKTKVGQKSGVDPRPGMRKVDSSLPDGFTFDGNVQAMGFRFKVNQLVVPMRLSTFNEGDLHNIVYILGDKPLKIRSVPEEYVVRQIPGAQLLKNVIDPLPLRIIGGTVSSLQPFQKQNLKQRRDPSPHNGAAKDLFAADLLAVKEGRLTHPHEEVEKMLLAVGERLSLRGPEIDKLNEASLKAERDETVKQGLEGLKGMTLSVIDGSFPREVLASRNLTFSPYKMPGRRNKREFYDAKTLKPAAVQPGTIHYGTVSWNGSQNGNPAGKSFRADALTSHGSRPMGTSLALAICSCLFIGARRGGGKNIVALLLAGGLIAGLFGAIETAVAQDKSQKNAADKEPTNLELIDKLGEPKTAAAAAEKLIARGKSVVPDLLGEALEGNNMVLRGWAIVCLSEIGGKDVEKRLTEMYQDKKQSMLVRTWAAAGMVQLAKSSDDLLKLANLIPQFPALGRPIGLRLVAELGEKGNDATAEDLLNVTLRVPQLQKSLASAILAKGADSLVGALVTAKNQNVRRQAAAYLGTLAAKGEDAVPAVVVKAYQFDAKAKDVPWTGGPLFIPGIQWKKDDAKALVGNLIAWFLWCEQHNKKTHHTALHNNLRSLQLAAAAGYTSPGFQQTGTDRWLTIWGQAFGKAELEKLLKAQGADQQPRYKKILDGLN
jgi:hypothetical protein